MERMCDWCPTTENFRYFRWAKGEAICFCLCPECTDRRPKYMHNNQIEITAEEYNRIVEGEGTNEV